MQKYFKTFPKMHNLLTLPSAEPQNKMNKCVLTLWMKDSMFQRLDYAVNAHKPSIWSCSIFHHFHKNLINDFCKLLTCSWSQFTVVLYSTVCSYVAQLTPSRLQAKSSFHCKATFYYKFRWLKDREFLLLLPQIYPAIMDLNQYWNMLQRIQLTWGE